MKKEKLITKISIQKRFQRSICIDSDSKNLSAAVEHYYCPASIRDVIKSIAKSSSTYGNSSFSWTGPYGMGKSSASLLLASIACGDEQALKMAKLAWDEPQSFNKTVRELRPDGKPRTLIPVVGSRRDPIKAIAEVLVKNTRGNRNKLIDDPVALIKSLERTASRKNILLIVDEMGKFLEHSATKDSDIYFWQLLAESATRSRGKIILIGILHQSFSMYANNLTEEARKEWNKVQGRFADQLIHVSSHDQINCIARALKQADLIIPQKMTAALNFITNQVCPNNASVEKIKVQSLLKRCLPLHPAVVLLLSAFSRANFVQTQRSLFSFLNSHEPFGFIDFLENANSKDYFSVEKFWDYLENNLKHIISESQNSHIWAQGIDAVSRSQTLHNILAERIVKIISAFSLLSPPNVELNTKMIKHCIVDASLEDIEKTCRKLIKKSIIIFRKHRSDYTLYGGSDFDIEAATRKAQEQLGILSPQMLTEYIDLLPVTARRFSYTVGASMQFTIMISSFEDVIQCISAPVDSKMAGLVVLAIPESRRNIRPYNLNKIPLTLEDGRPVIISYLKDNDLYKKFRKLIALQQILKDKDLESDHIARKEIEIRFSILSDYLNTEIQNVLNYSEWHWRGEKRIQRIQGALSRVSSKVLEVFYNQCPHICSELINVNKLSGSASSAMRQLMRSMLSELGQERLGIEGYPAHGGLFDAVLKRTSLYKKVKGKFVFTPPSPPKDPCNLSPLWKLTDKFLKDRKGKVKVEEIYSMWRKPPLGIKLGIMPILLLAYIMTRQKYIAIYIDQYFKPQFEEIDIDQMTLRANDIQLYYINPKPAQARFVSKLNVALGMNTTDSLLELARFIVLRISNLPNWTQQTNLVPKEIKRFLGIIRRADDPVRFLYRDLPESLNGTSTDVEKLVPVFERYMNVLENFLSEKLSTMKEEMLSNLKVSPNDMENLRQRAVIVEKNTGDLRLKAFAKYIEELTISEDIMADIAALAANRPLDNWTDQCYQSAKIELNMLISLFEHTEIYKNKENVPGHFILSVGTQVNGKMERNLHDVFVSEKHYKSVKSSANIMCKSLEKFSDPETKLAVIIQMADHIMQEIKKNER